MNFLSRWLGKIPKPKVSKEVKERILKNKEAMLDVMASNIQSKGCPLMGMNKCVGEFCELFTKWTSHNKKEYWRCDFKQQNTLTLELLMEIRAQNAQFQQIIMLLSEAPKENGIIT